MVLGAAVGGREDDYEASRADFEGRGDAFEAMLAEIKQAWSGSSGEYAVGPDVSDNPPELIIGGSIDAAFRRAAEHGADPVSGLLGSRSGGSAG